MEARLEVEIEQPDYVYRKLTVSLGYRNDQEKDYSRIYYASPYIGRKSGKIIEQGIDAIDEDDLELGCSDNVFSFLYPIHWDPAVLQTVRKHIPYITDLLSVASGIVRPPSETKRC